jgi:hypothetical protein
MKIIKSIGIVLGGLVGLAFVAVISLYAIAAVSSIEPSKSPRKASPFQVTPNR